MAMLVCRGRTPRGDTETMDKFDVLVIGLGPAGAAAATAASRAGARVLAVERRQSVSGAVCPEFIPLPLGLHAQIDRVTIQRVVGSRNHMSDGTNLDDPVPGCVVDRDAFDRSLVDFARASGAGLLYDTSLKGLDADHCEATLIQAGQPRRIHFGALVAADGHASSVARLLGLPGLRKMHTWRYRVALCVPQGSIDVWLSPRYPGGYGWLMPAGRDAVIGTGMDEHLAHEALDALHGQLVAAGLVGREILGQSAGAVPVEGLRARLTLGNILFAGDAAGMTHPITGAGVYSAVISGEAAGRAAAEWSAGHLGAIPAYEATMRGRFGEALAQASRRREPLESPPDAAPGMFDPDDRGWTVVRGAFNS